MADLPILFSAPMVRALLREIEQPGTGKTQTRRVLDMPNQPFNSIFNDDGVWSIGDAEDDPVRVAKIPVRYRVDDRLYVREAHYLTDDGDYEQVVYAADAEAVADHLADVAHIEGSHPNIDWSRHKRLRPPMHMPRWASRITLIVTDVCVQRLQDISEADAKAEGVERIGAEYIARGSREWDAGPNFYTVDCGFGSLNSPTAAGAYRMLWDHLNADRGYGWDTNPWVAAYTFRPILGNIDQVQP